MSSETKIWRLTDRNTEGNMNLTGKVTLVTGASRGIGRQIALTLAGYGATVIVNYNGSAAKAEEVVNEITANGGMAESMQCSVSDFEKSKEMIDGIVKKYGRLDILVNNAGITKDNLIMKMSEDDFDAVIATNLKGAFNCIKHVSRQMLKQRGGRIINISSVSGVMGNAGQADAGVAGGRLNDGGILVQLAGSFGIVQHCLCNAVLDGTGGIEVFQLSQQLGFQAFGGFNVGELQQRGMADQLVCGGINLTHNSEPSLYVNQKMF